MYKVSRCSNKILNTQTNEIFEYDDSILEYIEYSIWFNQGNLPEYVDFFDGESDFEKAKIKMQQLQQVVTDLRIKAKGAAIGKKGTNAYIIAQVEFYEIKNEQCLNPNNSEEVEDLLQNEADEFGITLEQFKALVIYRYNEAKEKYNLFMRMIERCRTKIQTLIENHNWENVETAFEFVSTLNNADQAQGIMDDILNL